MRLAIEPLNRFETSFFNTAAQVREVVDRLDHPAVGMLLDTFHMNIEEKDQAAAIRLAGDKLYHFHACGNDRGAPGFDHIAWEPIIAALHDVELHPARWSSNPSPRTTRPSPAPPPSGAPSPRRRRPWPRMGWRFLRGALA